MNNNRKIVIIACFLCSIIAIWFLTRKDLAHEAFIWVKENGGKVYIDDKEITESSPEVLKSIIRNVVDFKSVSITFEDKFPEDLSRLNQIEKLTTLKFYAIKSQGFINLNLLKSNDLLQLTINAQADGLDNLTRFPKLELLSVSSNKLRLEYLTDLQSLESLILYENDKGDKELRDFKNLPNSPDIQFVNLIGFKAKSLEPLATKYPKLSYLDITNTSFEKGYSFIKFESLETLRIFSDILDFRILIGIAELLQVKPEVEVILDKDALNQKVLESIKSETLFELAKHFSQVEYNKALVFKLYLELANRGMQEAFEKVGAAYLNGKGIEKDVKLALPWLEKAYKAGDGKARTKLGLIHLHGLGELQKNEELGIKYLSEAVEAGKISVADYLVKLYIKGIPEEGFKPDKEKANYWYKKYLKLGGVKIEHNDLIQPAD